MTRRVKWLFPNLLVVLSANMYEPGIQKIVAFRIFAEVTRTATSIWARLSRPAAPLLRWYKSYKALASEDGLVVAVWLADCYHRLIIAIAAHVHDFGRSSSIGNNRT